MPELYFRHLDAVGWATPERLRKTHFETQIYKIMYMCNRQLFKKVLSI